MIFIRVWVNGKLVHTYNEKRRGLEPDQDELEGISIRKGWNKIVVKCVDVVFDWSFCLRLAPPKKKGSRRIGGFRMDCPPVEPKFTYEPIERPRAPAPGKVIDSINLKGNWLLKPDPNAVGLNQKWHEVYVDTAGWKSYTVPGAFDKLITIYQKGKLLPPFLNVEITEKGLYNGLVWVRRTVKIPEEWGATRDTSSSSDESTIWMSHT